MFRFCQPDFVHLFYRRSVELREQSNTGSEQRERRRGRPDLPYEPSTHRLIAYPHSTVLHLYPKTITAAFLLNNSDKQEEKERKEQEEQRKKQDEDAKKKKVLSNMTQQYGAGQKVSHLLMV